MLQNKIKINLIFNKQRVMFILYRTINLIIIKIQSYGFSARHSNKKFWMSNIGKNMRSRNSLKNSQKNI